MSDDPRKVGGSAGNRGRGRKPGVPNKTTAAVKEALTEAFEKLGGVPSLVAWASTDKGRDEFYKLWVKMLPTEVDAKVSGRLVVVIDDRD